MVIFNKKLKIILFIVICGAIVSFFYIQSSIQKEIKTYLEIQKTSQATIEGLVKEKVYCIIDKGNGEVLKYQIKPSSDSTVFSLLEKLSQIENFELSYKIYPEMGVFVESIAGIKNGTDNKWWQYWVNGELPMVAADKMGVQGADVVEWKFAPASF